VDCLSRDAQVLVQRDVKVTLPLSVEDSHANDERLANILQDYFEDVVVVLHDQDERSLRPSEKSELDGNTMMQAMIEGISSCRSDAFIRDIGDLMVLIQNETRDFAAETELESSWLVGNVTSQMKAVLQQRNREEQELLQSLRAGHPGIPAQDAQSHEQDDNDYGKRDHAAYQRRRPTPTAPRECFRGVYLRIGG